MNMVTLGVASVDEVMHRAKDAFKGKKQGSYISFASPELLFKVMGGKRWELLQAMTGAGPMTIREAARRVERDVKAVHRDVHALLNAGVLRKTDDGLVVFPFDAIHADFTLVPPKRKPATTPRPKGLNALAAALPRKKTR